MLDAKVQSHGTRNELCRPDKKTGLMLHSLCKSAREAVDCVKLTHIECGKRVLARHSSDC